MLSVNPLRLFSATANTTKKSAQATQPHFGSPPTRPSDDQNQRLPSVNDILRNPIPQHSFREWSTLARPLYQEIQEITTHIQEIGEVPKEASVKTLNQMVAILSKRVNEERNEAKKGVVQKLLTKIEDHLKELE